MSVAMPFALVEQIVVVLAGLAFVILVAAIFVVLAKFLAPRLLGRDDGSSIDD